MSEVVDISPDAQELCAEAASLGWDVDDLFYQCQIHMANYDKPAFGIADENGQLIAALVGGARYEDNPWLGMRFSVCVDEDHRRQGHATALIEAFCEKCSKEGMPVEAWVVNEEAMEPLLEDLGFDGKPGQPIWTY